ncbi:hypothetical protein [Hymenobacter rubripertinctus]|uniref:Uncharacterized protein n=1 Tax=Hymenobacter rubripertinctus TaxID=2029981 RepID=A0A418QZ25_9BACT|nr:hypothetical protein [Hymenobacter rubripertinctus]RIY10436.1 hypothetical protein D0T11_09540 [Hymenobacter rubripertinctus]
MSRSPAVAITRPARFVLQGPSLLMMAVFIGLAAWVGYYGEVVLLIPALLLALFYGTGKRTLEVDAGRRRYRLGIELAGFNPGRWHPLPAVQRVVLRYYSDLAVSSGDGGGLEYNQDARYLVLLSVPGSPRAYRLFSTATYKLAFQVACYLGQALRAPVLGYDQLKQETVLQKAEDE